MPNSEYFKYKALLESDPKMRLVLDTIARSEGTYGSDSYSTKFGGAKVSHSKGKDRTIVKGSSAHGRYQFMNKTWDSLKDSLELKGFSPLEQDIAALKLLDDSGALTEFQNGNDKEGVFKASKIWAALPSNEKGESALSYADGRKQKAKPLTTVLSYLNSPEAGRVKANAEFKKKNEDFFKKDSSTKQQAVDQYWKEVGAVRKTEGLSPEQKNLEVQKINQKYYREGKMLAVNEDRRQKNNEYVSLMNDISKLTTRGANADKGSVIDGYVKKEEYEKIKEKAEKLGIPLKKIKYRKAGGSEKGTEFLHYDDIANLSKSINDIYTPITKEPMLLKYGYTKEEYLENYVAPETEPLPEDYESTDSTSPEDAALEAKKKADAAAAEQAKKEAAKRPPSVFDNLEKASANELLVDPKFKYVPGKQEIPFDALLGLTTGLVGSAAADVEIKMRDEKISEGMLQYAQDLKKIKEMGLPPEIEGGLKAKLNSAYQTGLTNIVRSSNGNRNLVLGNQGQLDKARMAGIVDIAMMDIERRDKAMASLGEVQKYINEFESRKDIANNERQYNEDVKKQVAGAALAQQGMASFIDAIQYAKANGPGSVNDMRRKKFAFDVSGLIEGAKAGEPGSPQYAESVALKQEAQKSKTEMFSSFVNSLTRDEKDVASNFLKSNPQYDPTSNPEANVMEYIELTKQHFATDDYKSEYQKGLGINTYDSVMAEKAKKKELEVLNPELTGVNRTEKGETVPTTANGEPEKQTAEKEEDVLSLANKEKLELIKKNNEKNLQEQSGKGMVVTSKDILADKTLREGLFAGKVFGNLKPEDIDPVMNANALKYQEMKNKAASFTDEEINVFNNAKKAIERASNIN